MIRAPAGAMREYYPDGPQGNAGMYHELIKLHMHAHEIVALLSAILAELQKVK